MDPKLYQKSEGRKRSSSKSNLQRSGRLQFLPTPLLTPSFTFIFWHPTRLRSTKAVSVVHRRGRINQTQQLFPKHWNWFILYPSLSVSDTHHTDSTELRVNRYNHKNTCWSSVRKANFPLNGDEVNTIIPEFPGKLVSQRKECPPSGLSKKNKHPVGTDKSATSMFVSNVWPFSWQKNFALISAWNY